MCATHILDTIVAQATPPGRSGIGVVRLSGPQALKFARRLIGDPDWLPEPNVANLKILLDPSNNQPLDKAIVSFYKAPQSFTGEDVIELSCHGSPVILSKLITSLLQLGARSAGPGEFTLRALSHGKLSLTQAEAVRDLIDAQTEYAAKQALRQLGGEFSARLQPVKDALIEIIVALESSLEFVEDDLPNISAQSFLTKLRNLARRLQTMAATFRSGRLLKDGLRITLVGRPNVGKSSLFNVLLTDERAIVTNLPGTTRDTLSEYVNWHGVPILLTDSAGIRESTDLIEQQGVERTKRSLFEADFAIVVLDGSEFLKIEDQEVLSLVQGTPHLIILNKSDLATFDSSKFSVISEQPLFPVSAVTGAGLSELISNILKHFEANEFSQSDFLVTNARHFDLLERAVESLETSERLLQMYTSEELILVDLYAALRFIGEITGEVSSEDILTEIFSTFCIGK